MCVSFSSSSLNTVDTVRLVAVVESPRVTLKLVFGGKPVLVEVLLSLTRTMSPQWMFANDIAACCCPLYTLVALLCIPLLPSSH